MLIKFMLEKMIIHEVFMDKTPEVNDTVTIKEKSYKVTGVYYNNKENYIRIHIR